MTRPRLPRPAWLSALLALVALASAWGCAANSALRLDDDELLDMAKIFLEKKAYPQCREALETLKKSYPASEYAPQAQFLLAESYFAQERYAEAAVEYDLFLEFYPADEKAPEVQFRRGMSAYRSSLGPDRDQTKTHEAIDAFHTLLERYPGSPFEEEARQRIEELQKRLVEHELYVARFYARWKGCSGTLRRIEYIKERYPAYGDSPEAIFLLGEAQRCLTLNEEALTTYERLLQLYPDSPFAEVARQRIGDLAAASDDATS